VPLDLGVHQGGHVFAQPGVRALLIGSHKATVASHVGYKNGTHSPFKHDPPP
jgi:hypothetical protein